MRNIIFFRCSNYINERVILFQSTRNYHPLNTNIPLFGDDNLSDEDNSKLFTAVQIFVKGNGSERVKLNQNKSISKTKLFGANFMQIGL